MLCVNGWKLVCFVMDRDGLGAWVYKKRELGQVGVCSHWFVAGEIGRGSGLRYGGEVELYGVTGAHDPPPPKKPRVAVLCVWVITLDKRVGMRSAGWRRRGCTCHSSRLQAAASLDMLPLAACIEGEEH